MSLPVKIYCSIVLINLTKLLINLLPNSESSNPTYVLLYEVTNTVYSPQNTNSVYSLQAGDTKIEHH